MPLNAYVDLDQDSLDIKLKKVEKVDDGEVNPMTDI